MKTIKIDMKSHLHTPSKVAAVALAALLASACSPKKTVQLAFNIPGPHVSTSGSSIGAESKRSLLEVLGLASSSTTPPSISQFAPYSATRFDCFFVNIMGDGIGAWVDNKSIVASSTDGSGYYGAVSSMLSSSTGGSTSVEVPTGTGRIVEVLGVRLGTALTTCPAAFTEGDINNSALYPGAFELGRVTQDTLSDTTIVVKNTYDPLTAKDFRYSMRDQLKTIDIAPPTSGGNLSATTTSSTATLTWTAATDNGTSPENLQYKVVQASSAAALANVTAAEAAIVVADWTEALTTQVASGLSDGVSYGFAVLVKDAGGNKTLYTAITATTPDVTAPVAGTAISFSNIALTSATVSWGASTDNVTTAANLKYKLVGSSTNNLTTVADAEINGTQVMDYTANTLTKAVTELSSTSAYYYAVIVKDEAGNKSLYTPASVKPSDNLTYSITYDGNTAGSGSVPTNTSQYYYANTLTVAANSGSLAKTGYTFGGWNTAANGSGTTYAASSTLTMGLANVTLYAQWTTNSYTVGGTLSGRISGSVVLQNNAGDNLTVSANGAFTFATSVAYNSTYAVTVLSSPSGQTCSVTGNGSGTMGAANVTNLTVACSGVGYTVGGTISGLSGTVVLQNNAGDNLSRTTNAAFTFATSVAYNSAYAVTVLTQPTDQTCVVSSGSGTMTAANVTAVSVACTTNTYLLTYDANGSTSGTAPTDGTPHAHNASVTVANNTGVLAKAGSTFTGWNTQTGGDGTTYATGATLTMPASALTLYAKWATNYTVTYNANTGTGSAPASAATQIAGDTITVASNSGPYAKTGFTFAGWNTSADGTGTWYSATNTFTMGAASVVLYAQWSRTLASTWTPQWSSAVHYWSMNQSSWNGSSGEIVDSVGTSHGTSYSGATTALSARTGTYAGHFNGTSNYATLPALSTMSALSYAMWFKINGTTSEQFPYVLDTAWSADKAGLSASFDLARTVMSVNLGSLWQSPSTFSMNLNQWYHLAVTYDGSTAKIYKNGALAGSAATTGSVNWNGNPQYIARGSSESCGTSGCHTAMDLNEFAMWSTTLSASEIALLYNAQSGSSITYSVGGTVSGLSGTVVLQNNAGDDISVSSNGSFTFTTRLANAASYAVSVLTQPAGQICTVGSGTGTMGTSNVTNVSISCAASSLTVTPSGVGITTSPVGAQTVNSGATQAFVVNSNSGHPSATVGGTCAAGSWSGTTYTTGAITADCTVIFQESSYSMNLLANGSYENGLGSWTFNANGSNAWVTATSDNAGTTARAGLNAVVSSYTWGSKYQTVDLVAKGYTTAYLDTAPNILVSEWYSAFNGGDSADDHYKATIELRATDNTTVIASYTSGDLSVANGTGWHEMSHVFSGYGTGVRYVYFLTEAKDGISWGGNYGAMMDDASVRVQSYQRAPIYVSTTGNDTTGNGSSSTPYLTIAKAVTIVQAASTKGQYPIYVAGGTYNITSQIDYSSSNTGKALALYGGFSSDFSTRNPATHETILRDVRTGTNMTMYFALNGAGIIDEIVVDGFTFQSGQSQGSPVATNYTPIYTLGELFLTITNNKFDVDYTYSGGVHGVNLSPMTSNLNQYYTMANNKFILKNSSGTATTISALETPNYYTDTNLTFNLHNNLVYMPTLPSSSARILSFYLSTAGNSYNIKNNTILYAGSGTSASFVSFYFQNGIAQIHFDNNLIYSTNGVGVGLKMSGSFASFKNNDIYNFTQLSNNGSAQTTAANLNALTNASGNISADPAFVDTTSNWNLTGSAAASVRTGGLDGSPKGWSFSTDLTGTARSGDGSTGWSMGAYEY